jgi:hypothetical protein
MFLARPMAAGAQQQLYRLSNWASGGAGKHLQHESWVQGSRQQARVRCGARCVKANTLDSNSLHIIYGSGQAHRTTQPSSIVDLGGQLGCHLQANSPFLISHACS